MILKGILRLTLFSFGLAGITTQLHAQAPATTFEELRDSLKLTDKESVEITDDTGFKYKARVIAITDRAITVTAKGVQEATAFYNTVVRATRGLSWEVSRVMVRL